MKLRILTAWSWLVAALAWCCPVMWVGFGRPRRRVYPMDTYNNARCYVSGIGTAQMYDCGDATLDQVAREYERNPRGWSADFRRRRLGRRE